MIKQQNVQITTNIFLNVHWNFIICFHQQAKI